MRTIREAKLKNLLTTKKVVVKVIEVEIQKLTNQLVLSQQLCFWRSPNYNDILEILQGFFNNFSFRWVDLELSFSSTTKKPDYYSRIKIQIFLFGKRRFILKNIKEISGRIVNSKRWKGQEAGISLEREFKIEDFF